MNLYGLFYWPLKMINGAGSHFETQGQLNPNKWHPQTAAGEKNKTPKKLEATGGVFAQPMALRHDKAAAGRVVVLAMRTFVTGGAQQCS